MKKFPSVWEKMSKNRRGDFLTHTVHDYLINATGSQKLSCLCVLDLTSALNTNDHNVLITRLSSWFGIHMVLV